MTAAPNSAWFRQDVVVAAVGCWRRARDLGLPVQASLYAELAPRGCEMLAPVFDSLLTLAEAWLRRRAGEAAAPSPGSDASLICMLLAEPARLSAVASGRAAGDGMTRAFECALTSTRIMLRAAGGGPLRR